MRITKKMYDLAVEERVKAAEAMANAQAEVESLKKLVEKAAERLGVRDNYVETRLRSYGLDCWEEEFFDVGQFSEDLNAVSTHEDATKRLTVEPKS